MRATLRRRRLRCSCSVHTTLLLACTLLFAVPREASAVVIVSLDPTIEHRDVTDFLDLSYSLLLGRAPDSSGAATFGAFLTGGGDTTTVATTIDTGVEYYSRAVKAYYQEFLRRPPTTPELSVWVGDMTSGATDEAVIAALVGSAEYQTVWKITTPAQLVDQMYHDLLGRSPSPGENMFWQTVLSSSNAMAVAQDIERSTEYRGDLIVQLFQTDLDRSPGSTEVSTFVDLLAGGGTNEQVIALLVGSGEFLADAEQLGGSDDSLRVLEFRRHVPGVPEPPALWLLAIGMVCLAPLRRFRSAGNARDARPLSLAIGGWKARPMSQGKSIRAA